MSKIIDVEVGYHLLHQKLPPEQAKLFTHHPRPLKKDFLHLILSKKNKDNERRIAVFNKGLKKLKDRGRFDRFYEEFRGEAH